MKEKNLIILCIIFVVLIGLVFIKKSVKPPVPTAEEITNIIKPSINAGNVNGIVLRLGDGTGGNEDNLKKVQLAKIDDQWVVETQYGVAARDNSLTPVLEKLDQLEGELRSNKKNLLGDYGISDEEGVHIELQQQDGELLHVIVGTKKAGYQNNFVRLNGSNAVYVVNENLLGTLGVRGEDDDQKLDADKWADKRIAHIDAKEVVGIEITESEGAAETKLIDLKRELVDGKKQWQSAIPYSFGLSASKIKSAVETFNNAYAKEIIAPDVEGVFDAPGWMGTYTLEDGEQIKLVRGTQDEEGSNYYVKLEGSGYFYLVPTSTFNSRKNKQGSIFANNPLKVEENNVEGIEIHDLDTKKVFSAVKKVALPQGDEGAEAEEGDGQEAKKEDIWENSKGEIVEVAKVKDAINALKSISLEIVAEPDTSVKDAMTVRVTKKDETIEYTVSEVFKSETDKECHFLSVGDDKQAYCTPKSPITSLKNVLP